MSGGGKYGKSAATGSAASNPIGKYEIEIERLRDENKWLKLRDLVTTIHNKDPRTGHLYTLDNPIFCTITLLNYLTMLLFEKEFFNSSSIWPNATWKPTFTQIHRYSR